MTLEEYKDENTIYPSYTLKDKNWDVSSKNPSGQWHKGTIQGKRFPKTQDDFKVI
jgi:hypothetical protein